MFAVAGAAAAVLHPAASEAMPVAKTPPINPVAAGNAVATEADIEAAKPEQVYWRWHGPRRRHWRRVYRRRRRYWRRRVYWHRPVYWRPRRVYWRRPVYWRPYRRWWW